MEKWVKALRRLTASAEDVKAANNHDFFLFRCIKTDSIEKEKKKTRLKF